MHTRLLSLLSQRLMITVLTVGLCLTGVSLALFQHVRSASAASAPYYSMVIGGQKYVAQYVGGAYNSDVTSHSLYSDFGRWNEYTVDQYGTWHWYGQFSGNENTYVNGYGKIQTGINVTMPGVGYINTYSHEDVLRPNLAPPPPGFNGGYESYTGTQVDTGYQASDCEVDASNVDNGYLGSGTDQFVGVSGLPASPGQVDCFNASRDLQSGDANINRLYNQLSQSVFATPNTTGPVVASLQHPQVLAVPVILGIASAVFGIASAVTGSICGLTTCSNTAKKVLIGVSLTTAIIAAVLGGAAAVVGNMSTVAANAPAVEAGVLGEAAGDMEMVGAAANANGNGVLAADAASEASDISSESFYSVEAHF